MKKLLPCLTLAFVCALLPAQAHDDGRDELNACLEKAATTDKMAQCATDALKAADTQLNGLYKAKIDGMEAKQKKSFTAAQVAWLKFRDAYCGDYMKNFEAADDATSKKFIQNKCLATLTLERNLQLSELFVSP